MEEYKEKLSEEQIDILFREIDDGKNGEISFQDFIAYFMAK